MELEFAVGDMIEIFMHGEITNKESGLLLKRS